MDVRQFFQHGSGDKYFENLVKNATADAGNLSDFFRRLALYHAASLQLPQLKDLHDEQAKLKDTLGEQLVTLDEKIAQAKPKDLADLKAERARVDSAYDRARIAVPQLEQAIRSLLSIQEPDAPGWLVAWIRDLQSS